MLKINNKVLKINSNWLNAITSPEPPEPPILPPYTLRLKYKDGVTPSFSIGTGVLVDATNNIWDFTYENNEWWYILYNHTDLLEVLGGNTTNITDMGHMFEGCTSLTTIPLFDTSNVSYMNSMFLYCTSLTTIPLFDTSKVTEMGNMFYNCSSLTSIPLFDTSKVTGMDWMFYNCFNVQSGALALYQQASSQANPPTNHDRTFYECGSNTTTGAAELAQIPSDWK